VRIVQHEFGVCGNGPLPGGRGNSKPLGGVRGDRAKLFLRNTECDLSVGNEWGV
jgi:hypothetical protein